MPLTIRKRGAIWHARGTIRVGRESIRVPEFSTGQGTRAGGNHVASVEAQRITREHLEGDQGRARRLKLADCFASYLQRPGGLRPYDIQRVAAFIEAVGDFAISDAPKAWQEWLRLHPTQAPATVQRWRTTLLAALRMGCAGFGLICPALPAVKQARHVRVVYLTDAERLALLAAYPPHAGRVATVLAYQGLRTQEALRLDWRNVDLARDRETLHVRSDRSKSGKGRSVPLHPVVIAMLAQTPVHERQGPVFLNRRGQAYEDTRDTGGNPLKRQHAAACVKAGIEGFRVHDFRHDWAARHVMGGTDFYTLMRLGGWSSLKMVERYASVSAEHMRDAVRRFG